MNGSIAVIRAVGLAFAGIFAGFLVVVLVIDLSLRSYSGTDYTRVEQVLLIGPPSLATATLLPALALTIALAILLWARRGEGRLTVLIAAALLAVAFIVSVVVNVPINAQEAHWSVAAPPSDWAQSRDRWQLAHSVRTLAALAAFVLLVVAAVRGRPAGAVRG